MSKQYVYDVIAPAFWDGSMVGPDTERNRIVVDAPLKPVPSWARLSNVPAEKVARSRKQRLEEKKKHLKDDKGELAKLQSVTQAPDFSGAAKPVKKSNVVTL